MDSENPYAASKFADLPPTPEIGSGLPWNPTEIFGIAWDRFKEHWIVLFLAILLTGILGKFPEWIARFVQLYGGLDPSSLEWDAVELGGTLLGWFIDVFFSVGLVRLFLQAARGQQLPEFGVLFRGFDRFLPMLAVTTITQLSIATGLVLLIVPGVFLACAFYIADYLVVDQQLGPINALRTSWQLTKGHRMNLVVIGVFGLVASLLGLLACLLGIAAAHAVLGVCAALIYLRLIGEHAPGARVKTQW